MTSFSFLDGGIVAVYLAASLTAGLMVRRYVGKVEDFLVAGREMDLYLGIASLAATEFGIVTCMYAAQGGYKYGFAGATPGILYALAFWFVGKTGFCIDRLRSAGVMTIPELFEKQFGQRIRWASGVVIVLGGLLNMGVFLRMGGEFLVGVTGLNPAYLEITMTLLLLVVALYTILGGMLSVLVTDYLQFLVMSAGLIVTTLLILGHGDLGWSKLVATVEQHHGAGGFNPFVNKNLGWSYVAFMAVVCLAAVLTWQTITQRLLAAKDVKTGRKIFTGTSFFFVCRFLIPGIWGIAALALIPSVVGQDSSLTAMPRLLGTILPVGLLGLLVAAMLAADMSTDSSYMLTWGSVIYNDILAPFRRGFSEKRGLLWNRAIIAIIGVFLLIYGLWYPLKQDLWTYLALTGTIYLSSMSILLVACCYWKRANSWGAAATIAVGALIPMTFLIMEKMDATAGLAERIGPNVSGFSTYVLTALAMVVGSLLKPRGRSSGRLTPV